MMPARETVLVLGAASDIGRAIAREYAAAGHKVILASRNIGRLTADAADLRVRGAPEVRLVEFDVLDTSGHTIFLDNLGEMPGKVICVVGMLGDQRLAETVQSQAELVMRTNYVGCAVVLGEIANRMVARGKGTIIGISSVAGDRGRATNYVYGSAKAGFTAFLSGLRGRLAGTGVAVITVKPGFVDTQMTTGMKLPALLTAQPSDVARAILVAEKKGRDVIYVLPIWRWIMAIIRAIPEFVFKRLKF